MEFRKFQKTITKSQIITENPITKYTPKKWYFVLNLIRLLEFI